MHVLFGQPSTVPQPSGASEPFDLGGLGFTQLNWTSASEPFDLGGLGCTQLNWTSASATATTILRGNVHKTDVNDTKSWRQVS